MYCDLHFHSYYSPDASTVPEEAVLKMKAAGVTAFAVTDHDSIDGLDEFRKLAQEAAAADLGFWAGGSDVMYYGLTTSGINLREGPGTDFGINRSLPADTPLTIFGRNEDGSWVQVRTPDRSGGWLAASLLALNVPV